MWAALGHLLPIGVAAAFSSVPIMATILLLLSPNRRRSSVTFLLGFLLGLVVVVVVFTVLAYVIPSPPPRRSQVAIGSLLIVLGAALVTAAIISWRRDADTPASTPKWLDAAASMGQAQAFGLGFVLNLRPKALMLSAAAGLSIRGDGLTAGQAMIAVGFYTILSISSIAYPIVASWLKPDETERWLVPTHAWITANSTVVSNLILIMVGVVIVGNGLGRL